MTVTEEPRGRYLTHYSPEPKTRKAKPAKQCAVGLVHWLKDRGIDLSLKLIGSDTTNEMSGWKGGMLHCVEELLDKRLFRSFCWLHINELPFRRIVAKLDGPTSSDKGWCGTVGKLLSKVETLERKTEFEPIPLIEPLVDISENIASQLSTDSIVAWRYLHAILKGKLDPEVAALNPFTVIPELTRHALTIVQRDPRVNSGLAICVYSLTCIPNKLVLIAISNYNDFIIL